MARFLAFLVVLAGLGTGALADAEAEGLITAIDRQKLSEFNTARLVALREAEAGAPEDVKVLRAALSGNPLDFANGFNPVGAWKCRVIKLGGILPLTVYPQFRCIIAEDGKGWHLTKTTGSQRTAGYFYRESGTRLTYLGSGYVQGEKPKPYGSGPEYDQVAYAERLADQKIVLQFPRPYYESHFDLLVLERVLNP
jgi:Domain of unknown function (DUF4893)